MAKTAEHGTGEAGTHERMETIVKKWNSHAADADARELAASSAASATSAASPRDNNLDKRSTQLQTYKTEICTRFLLGTCTYGYDCAFAHGVDEMRRRARHARYKTQLCRGFIENGGTCPYGTRCHFVHAFEMPASPLTCV